MIDNFLYSFNAVFPIFVIVLLGYIIGRKKLLPREFFAGGDKFVFKAALPALLFLEVANSDVKEALDLKLVLFCSLGIILSFVILCIIVPLLVKANDKRGAIIQGIYRSNFAILGVPLAQNMFGDKGLSVIAILMPFTIVLFNIFAVIALSMYAPADVKRSPSQLFRDIIKNIFTNPLIIAVVIGLPFMFTDLELPFLATKTLTYLSNTSFPLALMSLGANFTAESLKGRVGIAAAASCCKTIVLPAICVSAAALLGFRGAELGIIFILFGAPTAVSSYIMAKNMKSDYDLAGQILLLTTVMCMFTIFAGIFILKTLSLI